MSDLYANERRDLNTVGEFHYLVVPGASALDPKPKVVRADTAGTVTVEDFDGTSITYTMAAGEVLQFRPHKITAATATIHAWY